MTPRPRLVPGADRRAARTGAGRSALSHGTAGAALAAGAGAFGSLDTALNIAFPDLVADFDLTVGQLQWVVICFVAASGGLLIPAGALGDRIGHARTVLAGAIVSSAAMTACAAAPGFGWFLGARVVQGIGTAAVMASAPALATLTAAPERRQRAVGVFQSAAATGLAAGPVIGGVMVALLGWRGVFWFRVPLALALAGLAATVGVGLDRPDRPAGGRRADSHRQQAAGGDRPMGRRRRRHLAALAGRWRPLARRRVVTANLLTFVANGSMFATWLLVPVLLVDRFGVSLLAGGAILAVSPVGTALGAARADAIGQRVGARPATAGGLLLMAVGMALVAAASERGGTSLVVAGLAAVGTGLGLFSVPNMAGVMAALPAGDQGVAGALNLGMRTLGIVSGAAWHSRLFDQVEPVAGFGSAFIAVFAVGAGALGLASVVAGLSSREPSSG